MCLACALWGGAWQQPIEWMTLGAAAKMVDLGKLEAAFEAGIIRTWKHHNGEMMLSKAQVQRVILWKP